MDDVTFVRALPAFRSLNDSDVGALLAHARVREFTPGARVLSRGDPGLSMFLVTRGAVRIAVVDDEGRPRLTTHLGPGDVFGEMALLTGGARSADVFAEGDLPVRCLELAKDDTERLLNENPRFARFLTEILGRRLRESGQIRHVGKYRLIDEIGRGGGAIVWEGFHPDLGRSVAVKMLSHELVYDQAFRERFLREARVVAELRHENIVQVYDTESAFATFFIVMERLRGDDIAASIRARGSIPPDEARHIVRQIARALRHAHRHGVVHRDIKPGNVFLEEGGRVKVMDFGIASAPLDAPDDPEAGIYGTPGYVAPEALSGLAVDARADIYAVGVMLYEMLVGKNAFRGPTPTDVLRLQMTTPIVQLPPALRDQCPDLAHVVEQATHVDRESRLASCDAMLALLDAASAVETPPARASPLVVLHPDDQTDRVRAILNEAMRSLQALPGTVSYLAQATSSDGGRKH